MAEGRNCCIVKNTMKLKKIRQIDEAKIKIREFDRKPENSLGNP